VEKTEYTSGSMFLTSSARDVASGVGGVAGRLGRGQGAPVDWAGQRPRPAKAELDADDKHAAYPDAEFELSRAELQLLRLTGELGNWAIPSP
jgi:hypothetical protein